MSGVRLHSRWDKIKKYQTQLMFVAVFVVVGSLFLFISHAANSTVSTEVENGTLSGATIVSDTTASSGKAIKFGVGGSIPTQVTAHLPINLPTQAWLKQGITSKSNKKLVFAHYFTPYPLRIDNVPYANDWYAQRYIYPYPGGSDPAEATAYGGLLREGPLPQPVGASTWQLDDMKTEVTRATQAGLDGFTLDMLSFNTTGTSFTRMKLLLQAAQAVDPNFKIMLMPDGSGIKKNLASATPTNTYQFVGDGIASLATNASYKNSLFWLADGRLVLSPFGPELVPNHVSYWQNVISYLNTKYGIKVAFVPCFVGGTINPITVNGASTTLSAQYAPFSYGQSQWGERSPSASSGDANVANKVHATTSVDGGTNKLIWMQPVSFQDERPNQSRYAEAQNGANNRMTWSVANSTNAEWIQIPTWNDYSEEADIAPSTHHGWSLLDITSYYLTKYKMNNQNPPIVRDVAYLNHRIQNYAAKVTGQTALMDTGLTSTPLQDTIELETFLTAPATVTIKEGANTYTYTAPAGASSQQYALNSAGTVSATIVRNGATVATITSPYPVKIGSVTIQDFHYYYISSVASRNPPAGY